MASHEGTAISVENLVAGFGARMVLDHLSLDVRRGGMAHRLRSRPLAKSRLNNRASPIAMDHHHRKKRKKNSATMPGGLALEARSTSQG